MLSDEPDIYFINVTLVSEDNWLSEAHKIVLNTISLI